MERTTRRLAVTEAGRGLAGQAQVLLAAYADAMQALADAAIRGNLRITAPVVFGRRHVTPCVLAFQAARPDIRVELVLADRNLDLLDEGLDLAVRIGQAGNSVLIARRVGIVRRLLVASPGYLVASGIPLTPAGLTRDETIVSRSRGGLLAWRFRVDGRDRAVRLTPGLLVNDIEAMLQAARSGHGLARALSYQVADELAGGSLIRLLADFEPTAEPVQILFAGGSMVRSSVLAFVRFASAHLGQLAVLRG